MRGVADKRACGLVAGLCFAAASWAVVPGATDTFEDGSTNGWTSGAAHPLPPVNVASGGPAGAGDHYLLAVASGVAGPGGKLVVFGGAHWSGYYAAAGVGAVTMDLSNLGSTDLSLRLMLSGPGGAGVVSATPVLLPAGSGWARVSFGLELPPAGLVTRLVLFHGTLAEFPGQNIAAQLGIDNVSPVPEPRAAWLMACGLSLLAWRGGRRHSRT